VLMPEDSDLSLFIVKGFLMFGVCSFGLSFIYRVIETALNPEV
jgi:hypothetical protein